MPAPAGNANALTHGGYSERTLRPVATTQKRRLLRQIGLRAGDLDGVALGLLDGYARAQSKVELYDRWAAEHGYLNERGESPPWVREYFAALNSARLSLKALAEHLKRRQLGPDPLDLIVLEGQRVRELTG